MDPEAAFLSRTDQTGKAYECEKVGTIPADLRAGYYIFKALQWIESIPLP